jgi:hypothetical protein
MEIIFLMAIYFAILAAIAFVKRLRARPVVESLCLACVNAVVTRGPYGRAMVACSLGGAMRPVNFTVHQCSGFCVKGEPARLVTIEGFVRSEREVYANAAIRS